MKVGSGISGELNSEILEFCRHVAGSSSVTAAALVDDYSIGTAKEKTIMEVMVIIRNFQPRVMSYIKTAHERTVFVFAVDEWIFERDIERGFLGEAIAGKLVFPYSALSGKEYLHIKEVALKKRLILELLENLVANFPELANQILIKPQYFMYEVLLNRVRVFPLLAYDLTNLMNALTLNESESLMSYNEALMQLDSEDKIDFANANVTVSKKFILRCQDPKIKLVNLSKNAPRTLFASFFGFLPQLMNVVSQNTEAFLRTQRINWRVQPNSAMALVDPQKFIFFPTADGLVSLADKVNIKSYARKMLLKGENEEDIEVKPVGGMLNDVFLISVHAEGGDKKVFVKRFKDWSGFKWFPLTMWSFGAKSFAVSGQQRLAKECATSEFLRNEGFKVPKILHVSNAERLVFMEYIDGENLSQAIKRVAVTADIGKVEDELTKIGRAGELMAQVHSHNMSLGDTKPENMLIKQNGDIFMIDFEQAAEGGDKTWDIAVFLYYCGHYLQPRDGNVKAEFIAKAFVEGYLRGGGNARHVKLVGAKKYARVFSVFTMPATIKVISNICSKAESVGED